MKVNYRAVGSARYLSLYVIYRIPRFKIHARGRCDRPYLGAYTLTYESYLLNHIEVFGLAYEKVAYLCDRSYAPVVNRLVILYQNGHAYTAARRI